MKIKIGNNNKIKNSTIGHNTKKATKRGFLEEHPLFSILVIPFLISFIFLFSFWDSLINWIEAIFS